MKKIILESPLPEFEKLLPLAQELMMQDDKEFLQYYQRLRRLHLLNGKNPEEIAVLVKNQWDLDGYDLRTVCVRCKGKGSEPCSYCKNTGVCQICKGAGTRIKYETNADFSSTKHQVECPKECAYCDGQKKTCSRCHGKTGSLNLKAVRTAIQKERANFCSWVNAKTSERDTQDHKQP